MKVESLVIGKVDKEVAKFTQVLFDEMNVALKNENIEIDKEDQALTEFLQSAGLQCSNLGNASKLLDLMNSNDTQSFLNNSLFERKISSIYARNLSVSTKNDSF